MFEETEGLVKQPSPKLKIEVVSMEKLSDRVILEELYQSFSLEELKRIQEIILKIVKG